MTHLKTKKRIHALLFAAFMLPIFTNSLQAQTTFEEDSLQYIQEIQQKKIPQLIEVRAEGEATLFASPMDTVQKVSKMAGFPLFLLGDEGGYWACCYLGRLAYVRKNATVNTAAIQQAYNNVSRHYHYLLAYNAIIQGLQLALEYTEQVQTAIADNSIDDEPSLKAFLESQHRTLPDALPYLNKLDPRAFYGK